MTALPTSAWLPLCAWRSRGCVIPVFPGTNCEYDTARAFAPRRRRARMFWCMNNLTPANVAESCEALVKELDEAQILMLPGGFSGGDEPDGSAKFIAAFFRNPSVADAVQPSAEPARRSGCWASATASRHSSSWAWSPTARSVPSPKATRR